MKKLGIIAGQGQLPLKLMQAGFKQQYEIYVVALKGQADAAQFTTAAQHLEIRLGAPAKAIKFFQDHQVRDIIFAGGVKRPSLSHLRPDNWAVKHLMHLKRYGGGDDSLLSAIVKILEEEEGFHVLGAHEILPELVAHKGLGSHIKPDTQAFLDIQKGFKVAKDLGHLDIGQAVVVQNNVVLAVEAIEGTDQMLMRCKKLQREGKGGVLVKTSKPAQELRMDMPTIGTRTLYQAKQAGLRGVAVEAGSSLILEPEAMVKLADELGLFLTIWDEHDQPEAIAKNIYMVAGEASGDNLGAALIDNLRRLYPGSYNFMGIAGPQMQKRGLKSLFPMEELSVMGVFAVLKQARHFLKRIAQTADHIQQIHPDMVITIDSPAFCKRLAKKLGTENPDITLVHWVAPSVWAWKQGRAKKMAKLFDALLCLLPFEPPYFTKEGLDAYFTGHPVTSSGADQGDGKAFRAKYEINESDKLLCLLPGSRMSEVNHLLEIYKEAVEILRQQYPDLKIVLPLASAVKDAVQEKLKDWQIGCIFLEDDHDKYDAFCASDVALAASGTVSVELALAKVPMVIGYTMGKCTDRIAKRLIKVKYASLINVIEDQPLIPEFIAERCHPKLLSDQLLKFLSQEETPDFAAWERALSKMGKGENAGEKAAHIVHQLINQQENKE